MLKQSFPLWTLTAFRPLASCGQSKPTSGRRATGRGWRALGQSGWRGERREERRGKEGNRERGRRVRRQTAQGGNKKKKNSGGKLGQAQAEMHPLKRGKKVLSPVSLRVRQGLPLLKQRDCDVHWEIVSGAQGGRERWRYLFGYAIVFLPWQQNGGPMSWVVGKRCLASVA